MELVAHVVTVISIYGCLPLTVLVICWVVCCLGRNERIPVIYYTNLLISNVIIFSTSISLLSRNDDGYTTFTVDPYIYLIGQIANPNLKMCIAIERYYLIARPQMECIRQAKGAVGVSALVWTVCIITVTFGNYILMAIVVFFPGLIFIYFLAGMFCILPAATSVPTDEKQRVTGTLVVLLLNYFLMIFPIKICKVLAFHSFDKLEYPDVILTSYWLSPFVDLILLVFMRKGCIDKMLSCLCCCIKDNSAIDVSGSSTATTAV